MANNINSFVNGVQLDTMNLLTHLLNTAESEELNAITHSPYFGHDQRADKLKCSGQIYF